MNEIFLLYVWTRLDAINGLLFTAIIFIALAALIGLCVLGLNTGIDDEASASGKKAAKIAVTWLILPTVLFVVIPTQKDVAIIAGGWLVKQAATSEAAQEIGAKTYSIIIGKLDAELEAMKKK